jgi:carbonic anhydrase
VVASAWARNQPVTVHGWIYDVGDGRIRDLGVELSSLADLERHRSRP